MKRTKKGKTTSVTFDSTVEVADFIANLPESNESKTYKSSFFCKDTHKEAMLYLLKGYSGAEKIADNAGLVLEKVHRAEHGYNWAVTGQFFDIGAVLSGEPECWLEPIVEEIPSKRIKIGASAVTPCRIKQQSIENRGSAIMALIDRLFEDNYIIDMEIHIAANGVKEKPIRGKNKKGNHRFSFNFSLNNGYAKDMVAFCLCNPSFARRIGFSISEEVSKLPHLNGYGVPVSVDNIEDFDIYFEGLTERNENLYATLDSSAKEVETILKRLKNNI